MKAPNGAGTITKGGYRQITIAPKKHQLEHIIVAEKALGRKLPKGAEVHHVDENRLNNVGSNLVICPDIAYHKLLHRRTNAINAGCPPHWRKCMLCGEYGDPETMKKHSGNNLAHRSCTKKRK